MNPESGRALLFDLAFAKAGLDAEAGATSVSEQIRMSQRGWPPDIKAEIRRQRQYVNAT
jgi:hypothetical protein